MEFTSVNLNDVGTKAQSKSELYRLLTIEGGLYLPPQDQTTLDFISDICFGERRALRASEVKVCSVPHVKDLRSEDLVRFIVEHCHGEMYLPSNYKKYTPNRNTLSLDEFQDKMRRVLKARENRLLEERNLSINISSDIAEVFRSSQMVAVCKGKSHKLLRKNLLRKEKDARKLREKELMKAAQHSENLQREVEKLQEVIEEKEKHIDDLAGDSQLLKSLYAQGIIDADGNPVNM